MASSAYGIDLGTNNIKIFAKGEDHIFTAKNMIAIERKNTLFAYGDAAFEMYEKAPENIQVIFPIKHGVIADLKRMKMLFEAFFKISFFSIASLHHFKILLHQKIPNQFSHSLFIINDQYF